MWHVDEIRHDIVFIRRRRRRCCSLFRGDDAPLLHLDLRATPLTHLNLCSPSHVAGQQSHADARDIYRPFYSQVLAEVQVQSNSQQRFSRHRLQFQQKKRRRKKKGVVEQYAREVVKYKVLGGKRAWFTPSNVNIPSK